MGLKEASLLHPTDTHLTEVTLQLAALSKNKDAPSEILLPLLFHAECEMDDEFCGSPNISPRYLPPPFTGETGRNEQFWGVVHMPRGTYPPSNEHVNKVAGFTCPQYDGSVSPGEQERLLAAMSRARPELADYLDSKLRANDTAVRYIGSTCDRNVLDGTCPNENPLSDKQYKSYVDGISALNGELSNGSLIGLLGDLVSRPQPDGPSLLLTPPLFKPEADTPLDLDGTTSCLANHRGRMCGMFEAGDVSVDVGRIIYGGESSSINVAPGQKGTLVVHNNGVFGSTMLRPSELDGKVQFLSSFLSQPDTRGALMLSHFKLDEDPAHHKKKPHRYIPDQEIGFQVAEDAEPGSTYSYDFIVDHKKVSLAFAISDFTVVPESVKLDSAQTQTFMVEYFNGHAPPPGARYQWSLAMDSGTLEQAGDQPTKVLYTPAPGSLGSDTLTVKVFVGDGAGSSLFGEAQAQIELSGGDVKITPLTASIPRGTSREFKASISPEPSSPVTYHWMSVGGFGTLTGADLATVLYTGNSNDNAPLRDILSVVAFVEDGNGQPQEYGRSSAEVTITDGYATIAPSSASMYTGLPEGETGAFSVAVGGPTNGLDLLYQWQSLNGHGTVANGDQASCIYTVNPGLQPLVTDTLQVKVFLDDPVNGPVLFASDSVDIRIDGKVFFADGQVVVVAHPMDRSSAKVVITVPFDADAQSVTITVVESNPDFIPSVVGDATSWSAGESTTDDYFGDNSDAYSHVVVSNIGPNSNLGARTAFMAGVQAIGRVFIRY